MSEDMGSDIGVDAYFTNDAGFSDNVGRHVGPSIFVVMFLR